MLLSPLLSKQQDINRNKKNNTEIQEREAPIIIYHKAEIVMSSLFKKKVTIKLTINRNEPSKYISNNILF